MDENTYTTKKIAKFWEDNSCGSQFISTTEWKEFFVNYDNFKFSHEPHILDELKKIDFQGKRVLEIGMGQGAEAQKIIEAGAIYNGIDLTAESVNRVKIRFRLFSLPCESIQIMNAESLNFPDDSFDIVFSHGVIHHSPKIKKIVNEIHRVLRPSAMAAIMVYNRNSINYQISIKLIRRIGIFFLFFPAINRIVSRLTNEKLNRIEKHLANLKQEGFSYLKMENFIHKATDGPDNIFSSVFNQTQAEKLFLQFREVTFDKHFLNERHFPILNKLFSAKAKRWIEARYGWHLWIKAFK